MSRRFSTGPWWSRKRPRTLVLVGVLPSTLPADMHAEAYESFDLSARYFKLAQNALTLWREHDRLAIAITRGSNLVYYQALSEGEVTQRIIQDLSAVRATLEMQEILAPLRLVVAWTPLKPEERIALKGAFNLQIVEEEGPPPETPAQPWKLTPHAIGEVRRSRESRRWIGRLLVGLLVVYVLALAWFAWQYVQTSLKVAELRKWQDAHSADVDTVMNGRSAWKQLAPVVDYKYFPLELLKKVQAAIPADQLHLTLFESDAQGKLQIRGEAKERRRRLHLLREAEERSLFLALQPADGQSAPAAERPRVVPDHGGKPCSPVATRKSTSPSCSRSLSGSRTFTATSGTPGR